MAVNKARPATKPATPRKPTLGERLQQLRAEQAQAGAEIDRRKAVLIKIEADLEATGKEIEKLSAEKQGLGLAIVQGDDRAASRAAEIGQTLAGLKARSEVLADAFGQADALLQQVRPKLWAIRDQINIVLAAISAENVLTASREADAALRALRQALEKRDEVLRELSPFASGPLASEVIDGQQRAMNPETFASAAAKASLPLRMTFGLAAVNPEVAESFEASDGRMANQLFALAERVMAAPTAPQHDGQDEASED